MFSWKSKESIKKEQDEYAAWAFPHGQKQRDALEGLMKGVFPREPSSIALISFLTCKELYQNAMRNDATRDDAIDELLYSRKSYKQIIKKRDMPAYTALVLADADVDEECLYPTADEIRERAVAIANHSKRR